MATKSPSWEERAKRFLKAELARADVGYRELAERLKKHGLKETEAHHFFIARIGTLCQILVTHGR